MDAMLGPSQRPWWHAACPAVIRYAAWWAVGAVVLATGSQAFAESLATSNTSDPIKALIKICEPPRTGHPPGEEPQNCYTRHLHELIRTQGPTIAMLTLYQLADASAGFGNSCHVTAHHLSEAMYARVGNVAEAMALCQEGCAYACQHAVLTAYLRQLPQGTPPDFERLCPQGQHGDGLTHWQCAHGAGHGLVHHFSDVQQALTACKEFSLPLGRKFCALGVFMERSFEIVRTQSPPSDPRHHLKLCATVEPHLRSDCYYYFISLVSWASRGSVPAMFEACEALSDETKPGCYRGIGRTLLAQYVDREGEVIPACRSGKAVYAADCWLGFASNLATARGLDRGFTFCAKLPEEARIRCSKDLGVAIRLRWADSDRIAAECQKAGGSLYVRACIDVKLSAGEPILRSP